MASLIQMLIIPFSLFILVLVIYSLYYLRVTRTSRKDEYLSTLKDIVAHPLEPSKLPRVSFLIPVHNEETVIRRKLVNISGLDYPKDKIEVIIIDDHSTDETAKIAREAISDFGMEGRVLSNEKRLGVNESYNRGVAASLHEYVMTSDADTELTRDGLRNAATILLKLGQVGGVTARMITGASKDTAATRIENAYRNNFTSMLLSESAIISTYPGDTSFLLFRKSLYTPMSSGFGSSDGNISLSIIKKGFRLILAPNLVYFEPIAQTLKEQRRQKIRRATRLIQSTLMNRDILFNKKYKEFGTLIFPLRFLMMIICPSLVLIMIIWVIVWTLLLSAMHFLIVLTIFLSYVFLGLRGKSKFFAFPFSFFIHQIFLFTGLIFSFRKRALWRHIER